MLNQQYIKLGVIGFGIVAISLGIGIGVSTMKNNKSAAINAAKSMSTDLPWCPEVTRRELVVPGTESIYHATTDNLRGIDRKLGQILTPAPDDTPNRKTPMPTSDDFFIPPMATPLSVTNPTKPPLTAVPGITKGTSSPSIAPSSAKPSAAAVVSIYIIIMIVIILPSVSNLTYTDTSFSHCNIIAGV